MNAPIPPRTRTRRFPGRFEWKILGALLVVAVVGLGLSASFLSYTLRRATSIASDNQRRGQVAFEAAAQVFSDYYAQRKEEFRRRAEAIAAGPPLAMKDLAPQADLLRARLLEDDKVLDSWELPAESLARMRDAPPQLVAVDDGLRALELTFGLPAENYDMNFKLVHAIDAGRELDRAQALAFSNLFRGYMLAMIVILSLMPLIGLVIARRATRRLAVLEEAAKRVGEGHLDVQVNPTGRDELDALGRAFDHMVAELRDARSRLEYLQKVGAWQEVARRLAHEIKNPLTPVQLAVQELASKYRGDDEAYRKLLGTATEILREEIGGLRRLVDDFSAFAKLPKLEPVPVDLAVAVEEFVRSHPEWQAFTEYEKPPAPLPATVDRLMLRRALANLVENAVQAAEGAARTPRVRISLATSAGVTGSLCAVIVDDNGPGIPEGERERVFDPYVTTKENGTGLGLAIVRKIAIDHGGDVTITAAPAPLGGARLTMTLGQPAA